VKEKSLSKLFFLFSLILIIGIVPAIALAQSSFFKRTDVGTAFTYQGYLTDGSNPADGTYNFEFALYDAASDGSQIGSTQTKSGVTVSDGLFSVSLDFGSNAFDGNNRYLEVKVGTETLSPRVELSPSPYSMYSADSGALQGNTVSSDSPSSGQVLKWDGSAWAPATDNTGSVVDTGYNGLFDESIYVIG